MRLLDSNQVLAAHLTRLLEGADIARMEAARRMGVADGTLGRIKYGTANPTLEVLDRIARYYRVQPWELLKPIDNGHVREADAIYSSADRSRLYAWIDSLSDNQRKGLLQFIED